MQLLEQKQPYQACQAGWRLSDDWRGAGGIGVAIGLTPCPV